MLTYRSVPETEVLTKMRKTKIPKEVQGDPNSTPFFSRETARDGAKTLVNNGINYQPQVVFSPDFGSPSTVVKYHPKNPGTFVWSILDFQGGIHVVPLKSMAENVENLGWKWIDKKVPICVFG